jgi:DNA-binding transcriptional MerR regulator
MELLAELGGVFKPETKKEEWLKTNEVLAMMKISSNTLRKLRAQGLINPTKINGILYYNSSEIKKLLC